MARTLSHGRRRKVFSCTGGLVCAVLGRKTLGFPAFFSSVYPWLQTLSSRSHDPQLHCSSSSSHRSNLHVCHGIRVHATSASHDTDNCEEKAVISAKIQGMKEGLLSGKRASLAEAITLVESKHPIKRRQAQWLLSHVLSSRSQQLKQVKTDQTIRVGLTGPPGAGKSTLVETLGLRLVGQGYRIAVLAIDPSSTRTGGSILGDKTRMTRLACDPNAYIRPSPTGGSLGGVTRSTNDAILLCEGAGYDVILVETVGVGQSETSVADMVDVFVLVIPPAAGDELQGIKRGIVEVSDIILINKADGDLLPAARRMKGDYVSAVKLSRSKSKHWKTKVIMASALKDVGVDELWGTIQDYTRKMHEVEEFEIKRKLQRKLWMWHHIDRELGYRFRSESGMTEQIRVMEEEVLAGTTAPGTAADFLLNKFTNQT